MRLTTINDDDPNGVFYRRALEGKKFSKQCIGINKLSTLMKSICEEGGLEGNFSNHSGKRTCATALYQAGIEEQEIMNRTGHRSVDSVRQYKRPSDDMITEISSVLEPKRIKTSAACTITTPVCASVDGDTSASGAIFTHCTFNFTGL